MVKMTQHNTTTATREKFKPSKKCPRKKQTLPLELTEQPLSACFCLGNCVLCGNKCGVILQSQIRGSAASALPASFNWLAPREELEHMESVPPTKTQWAQGQLGSFWPGRAWASLALRHWAVWKGLANTMCCQVLPSWDAQCGKGSVPPGPAYSLHIFRL